ncbi:MAG: hypothetical protein OSJ43_05840 [Oscillospiraceae bacterium]|nr:hypothetical protein [Oscillospiraceae bacterium]
MKTETVRRIIIIVNHSGKSVEKDRGFTETYLVKDGKCGKISDNRKNT